MLMLDAMEGYLKIAHYRKLLMKTLNIPHPRPLPGHTYPIPFVIVIFHCIMKPYSQTSLSRKQHIYNYQLSCATGLSKMPSSLRSVGNDVSNFSVALQIAGT